MIYLTNLFWILVVLFGIIGFFRGAAKEMLVILSVLVALFFVKLLGTSEFIQGDMADYAEGRVLFFMQLAIIFGLVIAGYQTPLRNRLPIKDHISTNPNVERMLGGMVGGVNGYLIFGTIWHFMHEAEYPISFIIPPIQAGTDIHTSAMELISTFPAYWLQDTTIYFVIGVAITVILVLYI